MSNTLSSQLAEQFREVFIDGNWVSTNYQTQLEDVTYIEAFAKFGNHNTIALLTFHINYYLSGVLDAMESGDLTIRDKFSFNMPKNMGQDEWERLKIEFIEAANSMYNKILRMVDEEIMGPFIVEKYGNYYKNIHGLIEHGYYHLGQLVLIKKLIRESHRNE